ncbi:MAG: hypothetical protein Q9224_007386 [Gallowayella concinna]
MKQADPAPQNPAIAFSSLPLDSNGPPGNAWGRFGAQDQLGTLNFLTPARVAAAARKEIKTGVRISLDWPLSKPGFPLMGRDAMRHEIRRRGHVDRVVNDDERKYYNNTMPEQLTSSTTLGIDGLFHFEFFFIGFFMLQNIHSQSWTRD